MSILLKNPGDVTSFRVYVDNVGTASVSGATAPGTVGHLTIGSIVADNATTPKSVVMPVSGGVHGDMEEVPISITLSTGGPIVRVVTIRVSAGA